MSMDKTARDQMIDFVELEFIGPDYTNKEKKEERSRISPLMRYSAAILFPQGAEYVDYLDEESDAKPESDSELYSNITEEKNVSTINKNDASSEYLQDMEELLNLSNAYRQSAMSLTVVVGENDMIRPSICFGRYNQEKENGTTIYVRNEIKWDNYGNALSLPAAHKSKYEVVYKDNDYEVRFHITYRYPVNKGSAYTFTLENRTLKSNPDSKIYKAKECMFQVAFSLETMQGFSPHMNLGDSNLEDEDALSNNLLYRNIKNYAIGHGVSAVWSSSEDTVKKISTSVFPEYEIKPIVPAIFKDIELSMQRFSDKNQGANTMQTIRKLSSHYKQWIYEQSERVTHLNSEHQNTAKQHIQNCLDCHKRMVEGTELLEKNGNVLLAFQLMNKAMLLQQLHHNMPLQNWEFSNNSLTIINPATLPEYDDPSTWYDAENRLYGHWRPFQLAFVLINLISMYDKDSKQRGLVDLIWFPTGGGKTEAYLGLSAYTVFLRRILKRDDYGTTIIMRYTLRLLTTQQYERASSLICACELMRQEEPSLLGERKITIGLWVGGSLSPNRRTDAVKKYNALYQGKGENPFVILKCPWCGAGMGAVESSDKKNRRIVGYESVKEKGGMIIKFICKNSHCHFSTLQTPLPLNVVDDDIYENPPTLIIGTVDKFATLPYFPQAESIFGLKNGIRQSAPSLIIQDELHLISGPLGSMVGHYETLINELCTDRRTNDPISPKVIASTATISRAKQQSNALYNCGENNVVQFPPSALDAGDSFFAKEDKGAIGRKYIGIFASAASSQATAAIRLYAILAYAANVINVEGDAQRDPYWTNLAYFNSIRELGQTATWISQDISEYLKALHVRYSKSSNQRKIRYVGKDQELTSRIPSHKIPESLQNLNIRYDSSTKSYDERSVDICLATNMISVGVDIPRLGLMTMVGQPKTTSEYIQATSRVGRSPNAPGVIFTLYSTSRPRDRSHYETFIHYHSKIYTHVEPSSVTPFSPPLRERSLHAILFAFARLFGDEEEAENPRSIDLNELQKFIDIILERTKSLAPEELENTDNHLISIVEKWRNSHPQIYQDYSAKEILPLMFPSGSIANPDWESRSFPTPMSLRNVDASCEVKVIHEYTSANAEDSEGGF